MIELRDACTARHVVSADEAIVSFYSRTYDAVIAYTYKKGSKTRIRLPPMTHIVTGARLTRSPPALMWIFVQFPGREGLGKVRAKNIL